MTVIIIPNAPLPQSRPKFYHGRAIDPMKKVKEADRLYIKATYPALEPFKGAISVCAHFRYQYLSNTPKKHRFPHFKTTRPDLDNLAKYILDIGNGILWEDDSQIVVINSLKMHAEKDEIQILISPIEGSVFEFMKQLKAMPDHTEDELKKFVGGFALYDEV